MSINKNKVILGVSVGLGILGVVAGSVLAVNKIKKSKEIEEEFIPKFGPSNEDIICESGSSFIDCPSFGNNINCDCFGIDNDDISIDDDKGEFEAEVAEEVKPKRRSKSKSKNVEEDGEVI